MPLYSEGFESVIYTPHASKTMLNRTLSMSRHKKWVWSSKTELWAPNASKNIFVFCIILRLAITEFRISLPTQGGGEPEGEKPDEQA